MQTWEKRFAGSHHRESIFRYDHLVSWHVGSSQARFRAGFRARLSHVLAGGRGIDVVELYVAASEAEVFLMHHVTKNWLRKTLSRVLFRGREGIVF